MVLDQRNAGASVTPVNTQYTLDRWQGILTAASKFTIQQNAPSLGSVTPPAGFTNYLGVTSSSAYSISSGDIFGVGQQIEGFNIADLGWGTANAKTVTLSFQVRSSLTGTFGGSLNAVNDARSYPFSYTISSANTWTAISVTIAGDTSGTWNATNGAGIRVFFNLGSGSTFSGPAGAWAGVSYFAPTGATSVVGTNGATLYITGVQLEVGTQATSFEYRQYGTELALCQRYYWKQDEAGTFNTPFAGLAGWTGSDIRGYLQFPVPMRGAPTWSVGTVGNIYCQSNGISYPATAFTLVGSSLNAGFIKFSISGGVGGAAYACFANANPVNSAFSAEL
jgi:hypothetical protein